MCADFVFQYTTYDTGNVSCAHGLVVHISYTLRTVMISVQLWVSRSPVIGSVGLKESQYQIWLYLVEIDRVTQ
jgi:hypothetical protein